MLKRLGFEIEKRQKVHPAFQILAVVLGLLIAFLISGWIMSLTGNDPLESFQVMFRGAFGEKRKILNSLMRSTPLMLAALATVIAFKAEVWSIGQEGQIFAGAMMSFAVYRLIDTAGLSRPVLLLIVILAGVLGGALLGGLAGWLRTRFNVDIIISTVMLNYIITTMLLFLLYDQKYWMGLNNYYPRSDIINKDYWFPILGDTGRLHMGFIIAVGLAILIYWLIKRTPYGYDLRALGANPVATQFKGINVNRLILITMFISGGLAGLAGAIELFGVHHNVNMDLSPGYGYTGIIVALLVELNPILVIFAAIFFGGLINGSVTMITSTGVHTSITYVIQAMVLISVLVCRAFVKYRIRRIQHVE
jgi:simple sugar transport system permease protein